MKSNAMIWAAAAVLAGLWGCDDDEGRARVDLGPPLDAAASDGATLDFSVDMARPDRGPDADLDRGELDGPPPDLAGDLGFVELDLGPPQPEMCNGLDDDQDGEIDEEVSNVCGGCGGIPPDGCQAWRIGLVQDPDGTLLAFRTVGLQAQVRGYSERAIDGAQCDVLRLAGAPDPDAHLGVVDIDASQAALHLIPTFDERIAGFSYDNSPELARTPLHDATDAADPIVIRTGGGTLVAPFDLELDAPPPIDGIDDAELGALLAAARGEGDGDPISITWRPAPQARDRATRIFIGGSKPIFGPTRLYRGIEFYQLDARVRDDGAFDLDPAGFAGGLPESSIWVYAVRETTHRRPVGQHAVEVVAGQRVEQRASGPTDAPPDAAAPFAIVAPDPNDPVYVPGDPLDIEWGALPDGDGPLELTLAYTDPLAAEQIQINCLVDDPAAGALTLPDEFTDGLPDDGFVQLSLRWTLTAEPLPAPDRGALTRAVSMILRLDR